MATILIIDDEAHVRMLYEEELTQLGHEVKSADGDGDMATLVETISPDLIILDIKLDGKSGLMCCRRSGPDMRKCQSSSIRLTTAFVKRLEIH